MVAVSLAFDIALLCASGCSIRAFFIYRGIWWVGAFVKSIIAAYAAAQAFKWMTMSMELSRASLIPLLISIGIFLCVRLSMPSGLLIDLLMISMLPSLLMLLIGFLVRIWARYDALGAALVLCLSLIVLAASMIVRFGVTSMISRTWAAIWIVSMFSFWKAQRSVRTWDLPS